MKFSDLYKQETDNGSAVYFKCLCCNVYEIRGSLWTVDDTRQQVEQHIQSEHLVPKNVAGQYYDLPLPKAAWFNVIGQADVFRVDCRRCSMFVIHGTALMLAPQLGKHAAHHLLETLQVRHGVPFGAHLELETFLEPAYLCCDMCGHKVEFTPTLSTVDYARFWETSIRNHLDEHKTFEEQAVEDPQITVMNELAQSGHGHVVPRADGKKARCGGIALCPQCSTDKARLDAAREQHEQQPVTHHDLPSLPKEDRFVQHDVIVMVVDRNQSMFEDTFMRWVSNVHPPQRKLIIGPVKVANGAHVYMFLPSGMDEAMEFSTNVGKVREEFVNLFTVSDLTTTDVMGIRARWPWSPTEPNGAVKWMLPNANNN